MSCGLVWSPVAPSLRLRGPSGAVPPSARPRGRLRGGASHPRTPLVPPRLSHCSPAQGEPGEGRLAVYTGPLPAWRLWRSWDVLPGTPHAMLAFPAPGGPVSHSFLYMRLANENQKPKSCPAPCGTGHWFGRFCGGGVDTTCPLIERMYPPPLILGFSNPRLCPARRTHPGLRRGASR